MESPFDREVNGFYEPTFKSKEKPIFDEKKWAEESNKRLKEAEVPKRVIDIEKGQDVYNSWYVNLLLSLLIIAIMGFVAGFLYLGYNNYFKSDVKCGDVTIPQCPVIPTCPSFSCPVCPDCKLSCGNSSFPINVYTNSS